MLPESRDENRLFVDGVLRDAGIDLWGAATNVPALPLAPALPAAISLLARPCEPTGTSATVYEPLPPSGNWLAAGVFAHKTAATRAGLGWIGKTGLFVSPEAGTKLRLATGFNGLGLP